MEEEKLEESTQLWKDYEDGKSYQQKINLPSQIAQNVDFFEGRQWAKPTEKTKTLPRPMVNIIKMIVRAKKSAMNNTPVKVVFEADNQEDTISFTRFADYMFKEMRIEEIDAQAILDAANKGSYLYHFYWDKDAQGKRGNMDGAVRVDLIDPRNVFFANPAQIDEQKQKWIIIATREEVESVKAQCDKGVDKDSITEDERGEDFEDQEEQESTKMCTVLTRYFRKDGEVYCEKGTRYTIFKKAFPLAPDYELAKKQLGLDKDEANTNSPDNPLSKGNGGKRFKARLYPIVVGQYEKREKCIYGQSEVEGLIPNQKLINLLLAMQALAVQQSAWGKWVVKPDALQGQKITNEAGQVLTDYTKIGDGIKQVNGGAISGMPSQIIDNLLGYTRTVSGSTEVMTGEAIGANMSGAAIAQLQAQAQQPIEELRSSFWRVKEKQGMVLEQFFRLFYQNEVVKYPYQDKNQETGDMETIVGQFDINQYAEIEFNVVAKASVGTRSSVAGDITFMDALLKAGAITIKQYAELYPDDAISDKEHFIKVMTQAQEEEISMLKAENEQLKQQNLEAAKYLKAYEDAMAAVQKTNAENKQLRADTAIMYDQLRQMSNATRQMSEDNAQLYDDASMFAQELANQK